MHMVYLPVEFNQCSDINPWYGAGQGMGDVGLCWVVQSHSLNNSYCTDAILWHLTNPFNEQQLKNGIDAFMDDTTHLMGADIDTTLSTLLSNVQCNLDLWQGLIQASGGTLNP